MTVEELCNIVNGTIIKKGQENKISNIKIDTREIADNDAFIALKGDNYDGHDFINFINKNITVVVVDEDIDVNINTFVIKVDNTYDAIGLLIGYIRNKYINIPLIAITGSVGKTTTKELIYNILKNKYNVLKNEGNRNNLIGVFLTLLNLNEKHEVIILELGMNHAKEIDRLSKLIKPNIALITTIGSSHIGNLGSKRNILNAKMEIINGMHDGVLVINDNDKYLKRIKTNHTLYKISSLKKHKVVCKDDKTIFKIKYNNNVYEVVLNIPGKHLINNVLLAILVGLIFEIDINLIIKNIAAYKTIEKRMNIIHKSNFTIIDDCYNASYESLKGLLEYVKSKNNNKIIIIGDILELGKYSEKYHKKIGKLLNSINNKEVLLVGNETKVINGHDIKHFASNEDIINYLFNKQFNNEIIVLKGSRAMHLEEVKDYLLYS